MQRRYPVIVHAVHRWELSKGKGEGSGRRRPGPLVVSVNKYLNHLKNNERVVSSLLLFYCRSKWAVSSVLSPCHVTRRVLSQNRQHDNGGLRISSTVFHKGQARKTINSEACRIPQMASPYALSRNTGHSHRSWLLLQPFLGCSRQCRMLLLWKMSR